MDKIKILVIVGPTASGKTALSISCAEKFGGEIVSADSMQIYEGLDIATAKPTADEMHGIKHYMIGFLPADKTYSVADYVCDAEKYIKDIHVRGKLPIIVGGTGLYIDSLVNNIKFTQSPTDNELRVKLQTECEEKGSEAMLSKLRAFDPDYAASLHPNNVKRIIRALEIYYSTGENMSSALKKSISEPSQYEPVFIGINYRDRAKLYERIDKRVDLMLDKGLLKEAETYLGNMGSTAVQAIGYKELKPYLSGEAELSQCVENLKRATRNYAKRQLTWFHRNQNINWIYPDEYDTRDKMLNKVYEIIERAGILER
jgi:tRNA dimethylallyltransferase